MGKPIQNQIPNTWWAKASGGLALALIALVLAALVGWLIPSINTHIIAAVHARSPSLAMWLADQALASHVLTMFVALGSTVWVMVNLGIKLSSKRSWVFLSNAFQKYFGTAPQPVGTSSLALLKDKLFPDAAPYGQTEIPFYGREAELAWLHSQCKQAQRSGGLTAIALWGAQGIGKTHLGYRFAKSLTEGAYADCAGWQAHTLDRDFAATELLASLPKPSLLIWDDVSLSDDTSKTQLQQLRQACACRKTPLVLLLTSWHPREGEGLTRDQKLINGEFECRPLALEFASQIYPQASELEHAMQGHPLFLRLMQLQRESASPLTGASHNTLWQLCEAWAVGYTERLKNKHQLSAQALTALAVISSSGPASFNDLRTHFSLIDADFAALRSTGRVNTHQGALQLAPVRPDLLGWAFALKQLQTTAPSKLTEWVMLAWQLNFFDTGRFLQHATTKLLTKHPWVVALHNPTFKDADASAALARAMAAFNAMNDYYHLGMQPEMTAELEISRTIALRFKDHKIIQLVRAKTAFNAVNNYFRLDMLQEMVAELEASQAIALHCVIKTMKKFS